MRCRIKDACGRFFDVPNDVQCSERTEDVVRHVVLPPIKALARAVHEVMVIVVPPLAHGQDREEPIVAAVIVRFVTLGSEHVAE